MSIVDSLISRPLRSRITTRRSRTPEVVARAPSARVSRCRSRPRQDCSGFRRTGDAAPRGYDPVDVSAVAEALGLSWDVVNSLAVSTARHLVYELPGRLGKVRVLGVDFRKWKHVRGQGDPSFVTVIVDLTPAIDRTGPARLLDMVAGRSAAAFAGWLRECYQGFRDRVKVVSMDGFAGYHTAAKDVLSRARTVMDPFHVVHLLSHCGWWPMLCGAAGSPGAVVRSPEDRTWRRSTSGSVESTCEREPGENPGLSRSGKWERPPSSCTGCTAWEATAIRSGVVHTGCPRVRIPADCVGHAVLDGSPPRGMGE